jgi:hypothetical protein
MIYKITDSAEVLIAGASQLNQYNIFLVKGCLFISDKNNVDNFYQSIKSIFSDSNITEITECNLTYEPHHVIEWVKKEMVAADLIKYEHDNQEKLQQIMNQLDYVEKELFEGSENQCQRKAKRSEEDLQKTKSKSILMKALNRLGWLNNHNK